MISQKQLNIDKTIAFKMLTQLGPGIFLLSMSGAGGRFDPSTLAANNF